MSTSAARALRRMCRASIRSISSTERRQERIPAWPSNRLSLRLQGLTAHLLRQQSSRPSLRWPPCRWRRAQRRLLRPSRRRLGRRFLPPPQLQFGRSSRLLLLPAHHLPPPLFQRSSSSAGLRLYGWRRQPLSFSHSPSRRSPGILRCRRAHLYGVSRSSLRPQPQGSPHLPRCMRIRSAQAGRRETSGLPVAGRLSRSPARPVHSPGSEQSTVHQPA